MSDSIYTDEALIAYDIFTKVPDRLAQTLFYQCLFHIELFAKASGWLREAKEKLDYHNFARSQSCHMTEGLFGVDKHTSEMETAKVRTIGYLATTIASGHKFLRSLKSARDRDGDPTWRATKKQLDRLEDSYRRARNACEHLDQGIRKGDIVELQDFSFSIHNVLTFKDDESVVRTLDFSPEALEQVAEFWKNTLSILRPRERNKAPNIAVERDAAKSARRPSP
jgi:hypothetical protein